MSRLYVFPEEGWCKNATKGFGEWLAERFNQDYTPLKNGGYAWNSGSYWAIQTESGKPEYDLEELRPFYKKEGKINDESTMDDDEYFKYGSDVDIELFRPSSLKRHTKRSKRDLNKSIKGELFSRRSSVFDISALKERIRILKRQNYLLVRRSRK
jgi:hypothetical protein